jgi:hypothetical protein
MGYGGGVYGVLHFHNLVEVEAVQAGVSLFPFQQIISFHFM